MAGKCDHDDYTVPFEAGVPVKRHAIGAGRLIVAVWLFKWQAHNAHATRSIAGGFRGRLGAGMAGGRNPWGSSRRVIMIHRREAVGVQGVILVLEWRGVTVLVHKLPNKTHRPLLFQQVYTTQSMDSPSSDKSSWS